MNTITENHRHRRSIRLREYDYSSEGLYFITICVHERRSLFGTIVDGVMHLNDAGRMVEEWYYRCSEHFPDIECMEMVVMPNHFHCIWHNIGRLKHPVGADRCVRPNPPTNTQTNVMSDKLFYRQPLSVDCNGSLQGEHIGSLQGEHIGSPLQRVLQWFKTMTTNAYIRGVKQYGWPSFNARLWQRNYYEHIIRDQRAYEKIAEYIIENPMRWSDDVLHTP